MTLRVLWRFLVSGPREANYVQQVQHWGETGECLGGKPLTLPPIQPVKAQSFPKDWTWNKEQRRYEAPAKRSRSKSSNVTPIEKRRA